MTKHAKDSRNLSLIDGGSRAGNLALHYNNPNASAKDLLNDADHMLLSAQCLATVLAERIDDPDFVPPQHLSAVLQGLSTLIGLGTYCVTHAQQRLQNVSATTH